MLRAVFPVLLTILVGVFGSGLRGEGEPVGLSELHVRGTHYEIGFVVGRTFQSSILDYVQPDGMPMSILKKINATEDGQTAIKALVESSSKAFPQYVDELRGMADGSDVSLEDLFLINFQIELVILFPDIDNPGKGLREATGCSDVFVHNNNNRIMAHNEDGMLKLRQDAYLLHAQVLSENGEPEGPEISSYTYPGVLPGNAFSFNSEGVVFTVNDLNAPKIDTAGVGYYFLTRNMLESKSMTEVAYTLGALRHASGFSVNVGRVSQSSDGVDDVDGELDMMNVEIGPTDLMSVYPVTQDVGHYFHFNAYQHTKQVPYSPGPSSAHRMATAKSLSVPTDKSSTFNILGDQSDTDYPIFRRGTDKEKTVTDATAFFDLDEGVIQIFLENPKSAHPIYEYKF